MQICNDVQKLTVADFECIGQLAKHCDTQKLCIAIKEARDFDILGLLCDALFIEFFDNIDTESEFNTLLWCGGVYTSKCGTQKRHFGLKRIWVYYAYARYIYLNGYNDTPSGFVHKTNDFSLPTPLNELQSLSNKYKDMGFDAWERTKDFICSNELNITATIPFECDCECGCKKNKCGSITQNQNRLTINRISKNDKFQNRY
jgi:hypothetical protein